MGASVRLRLQGLAILAALGSMIGGAEAQPVTAHVHITIKSLMGADGGSGALFIKGHHRYRLTISGIHSSSIVREIDLIGTASNFTRPVDVNGIYHAQNGSASILGGRQVIRMENEHGVVLVVHAETNRSDLSLDLAGMTISGRI